MKIFESNSISNAWDEAYDYILIENNSSKQKSRIGNTIEVMKSCFSIKNSRNRWILNRIPMISPAFAIAEVFWILDGSDKSDFINTWNPLLPTYAGDDKNYYGAYGQRLRFNLEFDQLEKAYESLKNNPDSRQVVLQIWDGKKDLPFNNGQANSKDIPCNTTSLLKIRDNKLEWSQIMRSNDLFRGTPYNFIQFTTLQEIMAGWLGVDIGEYFYFTDSLHLYEADLEKFSKREEEVCIENPDKLLFSKDEFEQFFPECMELLERVKEEGVNEKDLIDLKNNKIIPQEYKNLLSIPLAYLALKVNNLEQVNNCEEICTNDLLLTIWKLWKKEVKGI
jgi:thymidylate synthase